MTRIPLNEAEVDRIMKATKSIIQDIQWEKNPNESWFKSEVEVKNKLKLNLKMHLNVNSKDYRLYSFTLILNNAFRITGIDVNGSHKNKHTDSNNWKGETHKHKWTDRCRDGWAYTPNDIEENSIESAFISFCKECEIDYKGKFDTLPPRQISLSRLKNDMR